MSDLDPGLERTAERLRDARPLPRAGFRAELRAQLLTDVRGRRLAAPGRLRLLIAAQACAGAVLLAVAAVGVAGAGPLAA